MYETEHGRLRRLRAEESSFAQAMYGWNHPHNGEQSPARRIGAARSANQGIVAVETQQLAADSGGQFYAHPMICHPGRGGMTIRDREWLVATENRNVVKRLWAILLAAPKTIMGGIGNLTTDDLDDAGLRETLIAHWRDIRYGDDGSRQEVIPGSIITRDLELLGLSHEAVMSGTVKQPQRLGTASNSKVTATRGTRQAKPTVPVVIRRRGEGAGNGR
jgi:hypothetical protein